VTLQLSGLSERLPEPRQEFYGQPRLKMPLLVSGKDKKGKVIGFEVLNYLSSNDLKDFKKLPVETEILA